MDVLTTGIGFLSFSIFLLVHLITFRWVKPERLLRSLLLCVMAIMALPFFLMWFFFTMKIVAAPLSVWVYATLLAVFVQGLLCFVYVLCIFGPYETSVRMRLVREIAQGAKQGISLKELSARYNAQTLVNIRLERLIGSGDIIKKDSRYHPGNKGNLFFIFDAIGGVIKKRIGRS